MRCAHLGSGLWVSLFHPQGPKWPVPNSEYKVTLATTMVISMSPMVHITESSLDHPPYPACAAGADPPSPPRQNQAILHTPDLCVLVYPTSPACLIWSSVVDLLSVDEWSADGPSRASNNSELESELSNSLTEHSWDAPSEEGGGSDIDHSLLLTSCNVCMHRDLESCLWTLRATYRSKSLAVMLGGLCP